MAALHYQLEVELTPSNPVAGQWVDVVARLSDCTGDIETLYASVPEYGFTATLRRSDDHTFGARVFVPWEANPGRYMVSVWGVNAAGEAGPRIQVPVMVKTA